jgi:hypothetical protein
MSNYTNDWKHKVAVFYEISNALSAINNTKLKDFIEHMMYANRNDEFIMDEYFKWFNNFPKLNETNNSNHN